MQKRSVSTQILRQVGRELIELMIGVAIIGILASIAISLYSQDSTSAINEAEGSELKVAQTSFKGQSLPQGNSSFKERSPADIHTLALDYESSDNEEMGYSGSGNTFETWAWHHNGYRYDSINPSAKAINGDICSGALCKDRGMYWLLFSQR